MKKKIGLSIVLLFASSMAFSQYKKPQDRDITTNPESETPKIDSTKPEPIPKETKEIKEISPKILFKILPLRSIEPHNTLMVGLEYKVFDNFTLQNEVGFGMGFGQDEDGFSDERLTLRFNSAIKYYFNEALQGTYISLDGGYLQDDYQHKELNDTIKINRKAKTVRLIFGYQKVYKRFLFDVYGGYGVKHLDLKVDPDRTLQTSGFLSLLFTRPTGHYVQNAFALGAKIGFVIK